MVPRAPDKPVVEPSERPAETLEAPPVPRVDAQGRDVVATRGKSGEEHG